VVDSAQSVCVRLEWVPLAVDLLQGSSVLVACVVGFHEGTQSVSDKVRYDSVIRVKSPVNNSMTPRKLELP